MRHRIKNILRWKKAIWRLLFVFVLICTLIIIIYILKFRGMLYANPYEWTHCVSEEDIDSYSAFALGNRTIDYYLSDYEVKDLVYALNQVSWGEIRQSDPIKGEFAVILQCDEKEYLLTYGAEEIMLSYIFRGKWDSAVWKTDNSILLKCIKRIMKESLQVEIVEQKTPIQPTEEEVLKMRKKVLSGMTDEEVKRLTKLIQKGNHIAESDYLPANDFLRFINPKSLKWKLFTDSGDVIIGYAFDSEVPPYSQFNDITEEEYNKKYGTPVVESNEKPIQEEFYRYINNIEALLKTSLLDKDLNEMRRYMELAVATHDVKYLREIYYRLHDMDYYLFQYGPTDVSRDVAYGSSIDIFYGRLCVYDDELPTVAEAYKFRDKTYFKMSDGMWRFEGYAYKYKLKISGYSQSDNGDVSFVVLSNDKNLSFEELLKQYNEMTLVRKDTVILFSWM